jgi:hypothetical protein
MAIRMTHAEARRLRGKFPELGAAIDDLPPVPPPAVAARILVAVGAPVAVEVERGPGRWAIMIANWHPASDNIRAKGLKQWMRAKKRDREIIRDWLCDYGRVPRATGRRRLAVAISKSGPMLDPQNCLKSLCDALVSVGLLVDDGPDFLELVAPTAGRGKITSTTLTIEDVP